MTAGPREDTRKGTDLKGTAFSVAGTTFKKRKKTARRRKSEKTVGNIKFTGIPTQTPGKNSYEKKNWGGGGENSGVWPAAE